jgi:hypothetical protein
MALKQQLPSKIQSAAWPVLSDCKIAHFERSKPKRGDSKAAVASESVGQAADEYAPYPFLAYNLRPPALTPLDRVLLARLGEVALLQWDQLPEGVRSALVNAVQCTQTDPQPQKVKEKLAALQHDVPASSQ